MKLFKILILIDVNHLIIIIIIYYQYTNVLLHIGNVTFCTSILFIINKMNNELLRIH